MVDIELITHLTLLGGKSSTMQSYVFLATQYKLFSKVHLYAHLTHWLKIFL